jgi:hypothetical protein
MIHYWLLDVIETRLVVSVVVRRVHHDDYLLRLRSVILVVRKLVCGRSHTSTTLSSVPVTGLAVREVHYT